MEILFDKPLRERTFKAFLEVSTDVSFDWFHDYFEDEQADRKKTKQDFTPSSVANLLTRLVGPQPDYFEPACGTGGVMITKWWQDCLAESPLTFLPSEHYYVGEELSDRAIPFLLFNLAIRGMNAIIIHGDSLERTAKGVFFVENSADDYLAFSDVNVMPYSDCVMQEFGIKAWQGQRYPEHIETDSEQWASNVMENIKLKSGRG